MLKHLSREIENHVLSLESVELSRWAMNCTASFQLMSNMGFTRNFAPQREKNLQQENQCPPIRLNGYELTPFPCYWIIYLLCVSPSTFHPEDVLIICQCQLEILGRGGSLDLNWTWPDSNWKYLLYLLLLTSPFLARCPHPNSCHMWGPFHKLFLLLCLSLVPTAACAAVLLSWLFNARAAIQRCFCHLNSPSLSFSQGVSKH